MTSYTTSRFDREDHAFRIQSKYDAYYSSMSKGDIEYERFLRERDEEMDY